jgi:hypothetical protein
MSVTQASGRRSHPEHHPDGVHGLESSKQQQRRRKDSKWEILTSLEPGTAYNIKPKKLEGFLAKKRKWPLKGWHKRYGIADNSQK